MKLRCLGDRSFLDLDAGGQGQLSGVRNDDIILGTISWVGGSVLNLAHDVHTLEDFSEDDMTSIEPAGLDLKQK